MCSLYVIFQPKVLGGIIISYLPGIGPGSLGVRTPTPNEPILRACAPRVFSLNFALCQKKIKVKLPTVVAEQ